MMRDLQTGCLIAAFLFRRFPSWNLSAAWNCKTYLYETDLVALRVEAVLVEEVGNLFQQCNALASDIVSLHLFAQVMRR